MQDDLRAFSASTQLLCLRIFLYRTLTRVQLGNKRGEQTLSYLKRLGSVTVLNGHSHQVMQKAARQVEIEKIQRRSALQAF